MESKFSKINHKFFQTGGRAPGAPALDPPLDQMIFTRITHIYIYTYTGRFTRLEGFIRNP